MDVLLQERLYTLGWFYMFLCLIIVLYIICCIFYIQSHLNSYCRFSKDSIFHHHRVQSITDLIRRYKVTVSCSYLQTIVFQSYYVYYVNSVYKFHECCAILLCCIYKLLQCLKSQFKCFINYIFFFTRFILS